MDLGRSCVAFYTFVFTFHLDIRVFNVRTLLAQSRQSHVTWSKHLSSGGRLCTGVWISKRVRNAHLWRCCPSLFLRPLPIKRLTTAKYCPFDCGDKHTHAPIHTRAHTHIQTRDLLISPSFYSIWEIDSLGSLLSTETSRRLLTSICCDLSLTHF